MTSQFDAGLYTWITDLAQRVPRPVDTLIRVGSDYGLAVFAVLMLIIWWRARRGSAARMATALSVPIAVVVAYAVNDVIKMIFDEQRPCQTLHTVTVETCPAPGDWSFPSNHAAIAAAAAVAILLVDRRLGLMIAVPAALLMAASRVWIGVHYPHDVLVGVVVGALVAWPVVHHAHRAAPVVERLRGTRLRPLLRAV
ncbi:phosphatase PAP2 family protein [Streptomyces sp. H10-C2]|uniref:phosphatase PAP2 family protein n=1 Tax=unclassified Streptomyces TaxID=2593676 RepID=UPI0024B9959C|nr:MULTISPECIES: phosphatase PAP2 family protein [unclassified Streptomyces]MDJ0344008.1 phosphatase PAP2 family protein [Streptomyces sp. PH10-H1]MDJ0373501.1 phosphatase PAP2 family protein [Streptomyces sp. H10-C2]